MGGATGVNAAGRAGHSPLRSLNLTVDEFTKDDFQGSSIARINARFRAGHAVHSHGSVGMTRSGSLAPSRVLAPESPHRPEVFEQGAGGLEDVGWCLGERMSASSRLHHCLGSQC